MRYHCTPMRIAARMCRNWILCVPGGGVCAEATEGNGLAVPQDNVIGAFYS